VLKLNLGCGNDYMSYLNCDVTDKLKIDQIVNLELPLRFNDNSVDEIIIYYTLEHVHNFISLMEELHRISKDGTIS
jgi:predicted SAM-dependent methyltransferase